MKRKSPVPKRYYADVMKNGFFAPPWWRWQRAFALATRPVRPSSYWTDDPMTLAAVAFIRSRASGSPREELARNHLPFGEAQSIFDDNGMTRWSVEGYTMAGLPADANADKLGLEPEVVRVYSQVMVDVRPRLSARDWICKHNYGFGAPTGLEPNNLGSLWRWVGYSAGVFALDAVRAVTTGIGTENYPEADRESVERLLALHVFWRTLVDKPKQPRVGSRAWKEARLQDPNYVKTIVLELLRRSTQGGKEAATSLNGWLKQFPELQSIVAQHFDLCARTEAVWITRLAGGNLIAKDTIKREIDTLKRDVAGEAPTGLEQILASTVAVT